MTVEQIIDVTWKPSSRWRIIEDGKQIFVGWIWELRDHMKEDGESALYKRIKGRAVEHFTFHLDIKHRQWEERGLTEPLMPGEEAQYKYRDLQEDLYHEIRIGKEKNNEVA